MFTRIQPYAILIGRIILGVVFIAHGWQKFSVNGMEATAQGFESMGIPAPTLSAYFAVAAEILGGAAFIVGALLPLAGLALSVVMFGAMYFVHLDGGFYSRDGGYEYVLTLAVLALAFGFSGGGAWAVDSLWLNKRNREAVEAAEPAKSTV